MTPRVLVDSNVILDVVKGDSQWTDWSEAQLKRVAEDSTLVINPIIFSEVSVGFKTIEDVQAVLSPDDFEYAALPWTAAFLTAKCFLQYRKRQGARRFPLPDFFIGPTPQWKKWPC